MALTYTPAGELGSLCPDFNLPSVDGGRVGNVDLTANAPLVVMFICGHCPYVLAIEDRLVTLAHEFTARGVNFIGICSNDPNEHPEDQPSELFTRWREKNYVFPYLIDADQRVARAFGAVCTPDLFVYDQRKKLCYRGRLDDSWRDSTRVTRSELREALEQTLRGAAVATPQPSSMGCSIKWKKG